MNPATSIEHRLPWSFLGFILGTASLVIAVWFFYLAKQEEASQVRFVVEDEFPLVELKEKFGDIKVLYNEQDILGSNKDIKIVSLKLENNGRTILQSYFDQNIPFGLAFENSRILSVVPMSETSDYLRDNLFMGEQVTNYESGKVIFKKPILEKGAKASFKVYLLQDKGHSKTAITGLGKISGLQEINISRAERTDGTQAQQRTGEMVAIGVASGYGGMLCLMLSLTGVMFYLERRERRKRITRSKAFCAKEETMTQSQKKIVESYDEGWRPYYIRTIGALASGDRAMDLSELISHHILRLRRGPFLLTDFLLPRRLRQFQPLRWSPEIFTIVDHSIKLNDENREFLLRFVSEVEEVHVEQAVPSDGHKPSSRVPSDGPIAPADAH